MTKPTLTPEARAAIEAWFDAQDDLVQAQEEVARMIRHVNLTADEMHAAVARLGCDNSVIGKQFPDYINVVRSERQS